MNVVVLFFPHCIAICFLYYNLHSKVVVRCSVDFYSLVMELSMKKSVLILLLCICCAPLSAQDYAEDTLWVKYLTQDGTICNKMQFDEQSSSIFIPTRRKLFRIETETGKIVSIFEMKTKGFIYDYQITHGGKNILFLCEIWDDNGYIPCVELWHTDTGYVRHHLYRIPGYPSVTPNTLSFGPKDSLFYIGIIRKDLTYICDYQTGNFIELKKSVGGFVHVSDNRKYLVTSYPSGGPSITKLIDLDTWQVIDTLPNARSLHFSSDNRYLAGHLQQDILLYEIDSRKEFRLKGHSGEIRDLCFTKDGYLVSVSFDMSDNPTIKSGYKVWDLQSREVIYEAPRYTTSTRSIAVSADNKYYGRYHVTGEVSVYRFNKAIVNQINNNTVTDEITIRPNPARSFIIIDLPKNIRNCLFTLTDMQGKLLLQKYFSKDSHEISEVYVEISSLVSGLYFYKISTPHKVYSAPLMIYP